MIGQSVKKTDRNAARTLAKLLAKDMLPEVRMKDRSHAELHSLTQTRDKLVKVRTTLKNKINNILSSRGIEVKEEALSSEKGLDAVWGMALGVVVDAELKVLVEQIRSLNKGIAELEDVIRREGEKLPGHESLKSIKGIGEVGASVLLSVIGDVNDFAEEGKLANPLSALAVERGGTINLKTRHLDLHVVVVGVQQLHAVLARIPVVNVGVAFRDKLARFHVSGPWDAPPARLVRPQPVRNLAEGTEVLFKGVAQTRGDIAPEVVRGFQGLGELLRKVDAALKPKAVESRSDHPAQGEKR